MEQGNIKNTELSLIAKIKEDNCNDSFEELSKLYDNFYYSIAQKYSSTLIKAGMSKDDIYGDVVVNGVEVATMGTAGSKDTKFRHSIMRFYKAGDVVQYRATTKTGTMTLQVNTEDAANESPILHMVLL